MCCTSVYCRIKILDLSSLANINYEDDNMKRMKLFLTLAIAVVFFVGQLGPAITQQSQDEQPVNIALIGGGVDFDHLENGRTLQSLIKQKSLLGNNQDASTDGASYIHEFVRNNQKTIEMQHKHGKREYISLQVATDVREQISLDQVISALNWVGLHNMQNASRNQIHVVYLGLDFVTTNQRVNGALRGAVRSVMETSTTIVVPAGNRSRKIISNKKQVVPAAYPETISVGTQKMSDAGKRVLPRSSNYGSGLDLVSLNRTDDRGELNPLDSSFAALRTIQYAADYIHRALNNKDSTVPSTRQVKWELVEKQSRDVMVQHLGEKKQLREPDMMTYKGNRVPDDYLPILKEFGLTGTSTLRVRNSDSDKPAGKIKVRRIRRHELPDYAQVQDGESIRAAYRLRIIDNRRSTTGVRYLGLIAEQDGNRKQVLFKSKKDDVVVNQFGDEMCLEEGNCPAVSTKLLRQLIVVKK